MDELFREIEVQGGLTPKKPLPIVSLELFFSGNDDDSSIGCNLLNHPGVDLFFDTLKSVRDKVEVQDIVVEIYDIEDGYWPFSERIYILTSAPESEIMDWLKQLEPSDIAEGYQFGEPEKAPGLKEGFKVYSIWWD